MRNPHNLRDAVQSLAEGVQHARIQYWCVRHYRRLNQERDAAFAVYGNQSPRGLHIGAADFVLENWFNTDLDPRTPGVYYLDATRPLPFPDGSFDFIFFEHMIEHIPFAAGRQLLAECRRVLKSSGVVRIATPNLRNILALISNHDPATETYLNWAVETFNLAQDPFPKALVVVNNFFRSWGHQFLYDPETMRRAMEEAGLAEIEQQRVGESAHRPLRGLERHGQAIGESMNEFETMVFEGTAP
jgi:predicted SAM-dependent methyltransferase